MVVWVFAFYSIAAVFDVLELNQLFLA